MAISPSDQIAAMIEALEATRMSRSEIALRAQVSRTTIWCGAIGDMRSPSLDSFQWLDRLCRRVSVDPRNEDAGPCVG